ncbi:MAG TPA: hypothetical protein VM509_13250, partial [Planctomycetota bacterium]|nr:hypothetical protein [Planctomycetota bacterium]
MKALLLSALLALTPLQAPEPSPPAKQDSKSADGALQWFEGTYAELGAASKREQRPVFVYLWADGDRWCHKMESDVFTAPEIATALEGMLAWKSSGLRGAGQTLAEQLQARAWPVFLFFDSQGNLEERLDDAWSEEEFLAELARVRRGEGTLGDLRRKLAQREGDVELRARYVEKLLALGDHAAHERELAELRKRDVKRATLPLRREVYAERLAAIQKHFDVTREINPGPLVRFLEEERQPALQFQGLTALAAMHLQRVDELERAQQLQVAVSKRADARAVLTKAAAFVPRSPALRVEFAIQTVSTFASTPPELSAADRAFLTTLAAGAVALDAEDGRTHVAVALAAYCNDDKPAAALALHRALELEPGRAEWT